MALEARPIIVKSTGVKIGNVTGVRKRAMLWTKSAVVRTKELDGSSFGRDLLIRRYASQ